MTLFSHDFKKKKIVLNIGTAMTNKLGQDFLYQKKLIWIEYLPYTSDA